MKDKLDDALATFVMVNFQILIMIGCIFGVSLFVLLGACFIDISFNPIICLYNIIVAYPIKGMILAIFVAYLYIYFFARWIYKEKIIDKN